MFDSTNSAFRHIISIEYPGVKNPRLIAKILSKGLVALKSTLKINPFLFDIRGLKTPV